MNWKRGLFRLWVVVSLLWVGIAIPFAVMLAAKTERHTVEQTAAEIEKCSKAPPDDLCHLLGQPIEYVTVWHAPPWQLISIILAVPLLLLGLGKVGYWVAQGFKLSD